MRLLLKTSLKMKYILSLFLVALSFASSASADVAAAQEIKNGATIETMSEIDRGRKNDRRHRRINKKRKRKCQQFGKRVYAG